MGIIQDSPTINKYKSTMIRCVKMYYPEMDDRDIEAALDYSISKRLYNSKAAVENSYTKKTANMTLLAVSDYIMSRKPIVTAFGTMFMHHADVPNPMCAVVQSFLDLRKENKAKMFKYPKGSEMFEKYNLLQQLNKIDCNAIYGTLGMYTSLLYNVNVATSITSQGRALVSSMTMQFEMFLANSVQFGSLNEVMQFIDNIIGESRFRKYDDRELLDEQITREDCFAKIILTCGYRWIPTEREMEIIWRTISNLSQEDINRVYYKNNLYEFMSNKKVFGIVKKILKELKAPLFNSLDIPPEISDDIQLLCDLMMEYVYYRYMIIDRTDRCDNMIKSVTMVSDTDSTIISLDAWYRFVLEKINGEELRIANYCPNPVIFLDKDEDGNWDYHEWADTIEFEPKKLDYNFMTDEIVEREHTNNPDQLTPNDNVRYSVINILAYVLDRVVNDYMEQFCLRNHSIERQPEDPYYNYYSRYVSNKLSFTQLQKDIEDGKGLPKIIKDKPVFNRPCKIIAKNEFLFLRLMMTTVKKNYASLIGLQEGNLVTGKAQLDVKGIECLTKSSKSPKTRKALQKILLEDILKAPVIDQLRFVKDITILEKQMIQSLRSGSKEYYKPVTVKSMSSYSDPMRIQGVKASIAWNMIKPEELPGLDLNERNAVDIAKVVINKSNVDKISGQYPEVYQNMVHALNQEEFAKGIDAIAIPTDVEVPKWLDDFIDYDKLVADNISGFPCESIGIQKLDKNNINCTNIVKL